MPLTIEIPDELVIELGADASDPASQARELIALELYREGRVSGAAASDLDDLAPIARTSMKTKTESKAVIPGFRAVESACNWKIKVAQETEGLSVNETLKYFRTAARNLKPAARKPTGAKT